MHAFNAYPWKVGLAQYKALEAALVPTDRLIKLAEKLTARLNDGVSYGHCAAYLYGTWAAGVGRAAVVAYWLAYDEHCAYIAAHQEEPKPIADDADFDLDIPDPAPTYVAPQKRPIEPVDAGVNSVLDMFD